MLMFPLRVFLSRVLILSPSKSVQLIFNILRQQRPSLRPEAFVHLGKLLFKVLISSAYTFYPFKGIG